MDALTAAFGSTGQPVPGEDGVTVWYLEDGFETAVPADRIGRYTGRERAASVVQPVQHAASARDQASQLRDAVELAYCQPAVGAFFNFQLVASAASAAGSRGCSGPTAPASPRTRSSGRW